MALLLDIRNYVQERGSTSLLDISNRFHTPPDALRGMLEHWIRKEVIRRVDFSADCGGCSAEGNCGDCGTQAAFETYEWAE